MRQLLTIENPLNMIRKTFSFTLNIYIFVLKFGYVGERLDKEVRDVTDWTANNYNTRIAQ